MKILQITDVSACNQRFSIALGNFDGMHRGHEYLIRRMVHDQNSAVILFTDHTKNTLDESTFPILTSTDDKIALLKNIGVQYVFLIDFDEKIANLQPEQFLEFLYNKLSFYKVTVGKDYRFGKNALGSVKTLDIFCKKYSFELNIIEDFFTDNINVRSTFIRSLLKSGKVEHIKKYLGRDYSVVGKVVQGKKRGREFDFPTCNLLNLYNYMLPKDGVYLTKTVYEDKVYLSITSVGANVTFDENNRSVETYIFNFNKYIYHKSIQIYFLKYMRDMIRFDSVEQLVHQLNKDKKYAEIAKIFYNL